MPRRAHSFEVGGFYHVFNRGVEKRKLFLNDADRQQFIRTLAFYQQRDRANRLSLTEFELPDRQAPLLYSIHAFCLMENHFHLLLEEQSEGGIQYGLRHALDSYARYFNRKRSRVGSLFQGRFKSVPVTTDEQLLHVARYIFLNPYVANMEEQVGTYAWNGYREYTQKVEFGLSDQTMLLGQFQGNLERLKEFVEDHAGYARSLGQLKDLMID